MEKCNICSNKKLQNNFNLYNLINKNIKFNSVYLICQECFLCDSYLDLLVILNKNNIDITSLYFNFKIFIYDNKMYVLNHEWKDFIKNNFKKILTINRKIKLLEELNEKKLTYKKGNLCDAYIKYGSPSLEHVINTLYTEQINTNNRLHLLIQKLKKHNLQYNNLLPCFNKFVKNGGNIDKVIQESQIEQIFVEHTQYLQYLKHNDIKTAKYLASIEFTNSCKKNETIEKYIQNKNSLKFE